MVSNGPNKNRHLSCGQKYFHLIDNNESTRYHSVQTLYKIKTKYEDYVSRPRTILTVRMVGFFIRIKRPGSGCSTLLDKEVMGSNPTRCSCGKLSFSISLFFVLKQVPRGKSTLLIFLIAAWLNKVKYL